MRPILIALTLSLCALRASAVPTPTRAVPGFAVNDLNGNRHTPQHLLGAWTVALAMTDKDIGPSVAAWWRRIEPISPAGVRLVNFVALDIVGIVPTDFLLSEARSQTPRHRWGDVWFSRDGSFGEQLGLPDSETPWVFIIDPRGRVGEAVHGFANVTEAERVVEAIRHLPTGPTVALRP